MMSKPLWSTYIFSCSIKHSNDLTAHPNASINRVKSGVQFRLLIALHLAIRHAISLLSIVATPACHLPDARSVDQIPLPIQRWPSSKQILVQTQTNWQVMASDAATCSHNIRCGSMNHVLSPDTHRICLDAEQNAMFASVCVRAERSRVSIKQLAELINLLRACSLDLLQ